jgi:hypothetical protein
MKKTIQTILCTSLVLVCTLLVQQLSAKEVIATNATSPFITPSIFNNTDFTVTVTLHYLADLRPGPDKTYTIAPRNTIVCEKRNLLLKSITGSFAASGNKTVTEVTQFSAVAGTAFNDFQIEQNVIDEESGTGTTYKCVIYRVGERLINNIGPGFTFINKTNFTLKVGMLTHIVLVEKYLAMGPKSTKSDDTNESGWRDLGAWLIHIWDIEPKMSLYANESEYLIKWGKDQATIAGNNPDSLKLGTIDNGRLFSTYTVRERNKILEDYSYLRWGGQYTGANKIFSTSSVHPTYEISGGYYYDKNLNQIVLVPLCITKKNDYGTGNAGDQICDTN